MYLTCVKHLRLKSTHFLTFFFFFLSTLRDQQVTQISSVFSLNFSTKKYGEKILHFRSVNRIKK